MALEDFLGKRVVQIVGSTDHETDGDEVTIQVRVTCGAGHEYPEMTYHPKAADEEERLEGRYSDGHLITITRRADGIDCKITGGLPDTGSWTADDHGAEGGGE